MVEAQQVYDAYREDAEAAAKRFAGREMVVSGEFLRIVPDGYGSLDMRLKTSNPEAPLGVDLAGIAIDDAKKLSPGQRVTVSCQGMGGGGDDPWVRELRDSAGGGRRQRICRSARSVPAPPAPTPPAPPNSVRHAPPPRSEFHHRPPLPLLRRAGAVGDDPAPDPRRSGHAGLHAQGKRLPHRMPARACCGPRCSSPSTATGTAGRRCSMTTPTSTASPAPCAPRPSPPPTSSASASRSPPAPSSAPEFDEQTLPLHFDCLAAVSTSRLF